MLSSILNILSTRRLSLLTLWASASLIINYAPPAQAQESLFQHLLIDAAGTYWYALHHTTEDGLHTDVCSAGVRLHGAEPLFFRSGNMGIEIRSANAKWNLAPNTTGEMTVTVDNYHQTFPLQYLESAMLGIAITPDDLLPLLDQLEKGQKAQIQFGQKTKITIPLQGSRKALDAFRTCTASAGFGNLGGPVDENSPF